MNNQDGNGQYIWLRYATEYSKDGRTHTVEMGVPIPLGASAEQREELFREAEIGMSQLAQHVDQRVSQALGYVQGAQNAENRKTTAPASPAAKASPAPTSLPSSTASVPSNAASTAARVTSDQAPPAQARPANKPASIPAPQTASQAPNNERVSAPAGQAQDIPQNRPHVGASMPTSLSPNSMGGNLQIPDFVSYINENMNLKPRQAMDLLGVKSLSGINLREALEHLKRIVAQNAQNGQSGMDIAQQATQQQASIVRESRPAISSAPPTPSTPPSQPKASARQDSSIPINELSTRPPAKAAEDAGQRREPIPQQVQPARGFDEEVGEDDELEDLEELDNFSPAAEFSPEQLDQARLKINSLREMQGAAVANPARLQALRNAADEEVSDEELLELAIGIWNIQSMKKLKVDQVEALISWAKQDYFLEESEAVLTILEEERYARGNR